MTTRHCLFLVNSRAGGGRRLSEVGVCARSLISLGWKVDVATPADSVRMRDRAVQAVNESWDCLVVAGGDGTWHDVLQAVAMSPLPMALLPIGTGDDNARSLQFPSRDPRALTTLIHEGARRTIDLGRITLDDQVRWFSGIASIGFDSQVNARANDYQRLPGTARYLVAAARELSTFTPGRYIITTEGDHSGKQRQEIEAMLIAVGNGGYYGGGMAICPDFRLDDGHLDATIIGRLPRWRFVKTLPTVYRGTHVRDASVTTLRATRITVEGDDQLVFADGEFVGTLPVILESIPDALTIVSA